MVARYLFDQGAAAVVLEDDEVTQELEEPAFLEHALDQHLERYQVELAERLLDHAVVHRRRQDDQRVVGIVGDDANLAAFGDGEDLGLARGRGPGHGSISWGPFGRRPRLAPRLGPAGGGLRGLP